MMTVSVNTSEHLEEATLQQYFDGELPDDEMTRVRELVEASEIETARMDSLGHLSALLKDTFDNAVVPDSADALFDRIALGVANDEAEGKRGFQLVDGTVSKAPEAVHSPEAKPSMELWKVAVPIATLAAAAAVMFVILSPNAGGNVGEGLASNDAPSVAVEETTVTVVEPPQGTQVLEVDFGENTGTVFEVEGSLGEPIAVVWINDDSIGDGAGLEDDLEREL